MEVAGIGHLECGIRHHTPVISTFAEIFIDPLFGGGTALLPFVHPLHPNVHVGHQAGIVKGNGHIDTFAPAIRLILHLGGKALDLQLSGILEPFLIPQIEPVGF